MNFHYDAMTQARTDEENAMRRYNDAMRYIDAMTPPTMYRITVRSHEIQCIARDNLSVQIIVQSLFNGPLSRFGLDNGFWFWPMNSQIVGTFTHGAIEIDVETVS